MNSYSFIFYTQLTFFLFLSFFLLGKGFVNSDEQTLLSNLETKRIMNMKLKYQADLSQARFTVFKNEVAKMLPKVHENILKEEGVRALASISNPKILPGDFISPDILLNRAKGYFEDGNYEKALIYYEDVFSLYPHSSLSLEARFLAIESAYALKKYEKVIQYSQVMLSQFPESEMTGLSLILLSEMFKALGREHEAAVMVHVVLEHFPQLEPVLKRRGESQ